MKITFGMHWDGCAPTGGAALGESIVGPLGMLQLLEARLGPRPSIRPVERLVEARQALADFYSGDGTHGKHSFERDSLAVADLFLRQRDELMLAGWDGKSALDGSPRLRAILGFSEKLSAGACHGEGDRLAAIAAALERRPLRWESVGVVEPSKHVPLAWRRVLDKLAAGYDTGSLENDRVADEDLDLERFRRAVTQKTTDVELRRDGSLEIVTAHSEWTLAQALQQMVGRGESALVVGGPHSELPDRALLRADQPTIGVKARSRARAIPQVLGLALSLRWKPLDPQRLLEFLQHPVSPVTHVLRHRLSKALLNVPGVGGKKWNGAIKEARERIAEKHLENPEEKARMLARIDKDLEDWIEVQRYDEGGPAPAAALTDTCARVAAWASRRLGRFAEGNDPEATLFRTLAVDAGQLAKILKPMDTIAHPELDRLLCETLGAGSGTGEPPAELGHTRFAASPGAIHEPADVVFWWNAEEPADPAATFWTRSERNALAEAGVHLPEAADLLAADSTAWMRPLFAARKRLVMFLALQRAGEPLAQHPLISRLRALLGKMPIPRRDLDREFEGDAGLAGLESRELNPIALPKLRRWWRLPEGVLLPRRDEESFSSLEKFIYSPYRWALEYAARIRPGSLGTDSLECGPRLYGTLIHRLLEDLFNEDPPLGLDWRGADAEAIESWVRNRWAKLLEEEGAPLLVPGWQSERARVLAEAVQSIRDVVRLCRIWGVTAASADYTPEAAQFQGGRVSGHIDLLLTGANGRKAVVDFKYGRRSDKERQVKEGRPLQLAVYGFLLSEGRAPFPPGAFYILADQRLLTADESFFKDVPSLTPAAGNAEQGAIWTEFAQIWEWRRRQLDEGRIEITVEGTPDEDSEPPLPHWAPPKGSDKYNDHAVLTGF